MMCNHPEIGVVVVMEKTVMPALAQLARQHHWQVIHLPTAIAVAKAIGRKRLDTVVIHIAVDAKQSLDLIRWLRATRDRLLLIAAASNHNEQIERLVRQAGVNCYLSQVDEASLGRAIAGVLRPGTHRPAGEAAPPRALENARRATELSPSSS